MNLLEIAEKLRTENLNPTEVSDIRLKLAGEFVYLAELLNEVLKAKPEVWLALREKEKSDLQAEKQWQKSDLGRQETGLRLKMRSIEKMLSALRTRLEVYGSEARNIF